MKMSKSIIKFSKKYYDNNFVDAMLMKIVKFIDENSELNATHSCNGRKYYMYDFAICKYGFGNEKRKLRQLALLYAVREQVNILVR